MLWLWCRPAAAAPTGPLAWELPYASSAALKIKRKKRQDQTQAVTPFSLFQVSKTRRLRHILGHLLRERFRLKLLTGDSGALPQGEIPAPAGQDQVPGPPGADHDPVPQHHPVGNKVHAGAGGWRCALWPWASWNNGRWATAERQGRMWVSPFLFNSAF